MADAQIVIDCRGRPGAAGVVPWTLISASQALLPATRYGVDTTAAPVTLTLPPLSTVQPGWEIAVCDMGGQAAAHPITFAPGAGGDEINGATADVAFATARGICRLIVNYAGTSWSLVLG